VILLNSITIVFGKLVRAVYLISSIALAALMVLTYIVVYNAVTLAGFTPFLIPLISIAPIIIGNILLFFGYRRFKD
jgi:hypothetical protein